jgi:asparagine synthase (glutamine-hydrolysing)
VGVYLSGGLDSCATLGVTRELLGPSEPIDAFTISFVSDDPSDSIYDEYDIAKRMAEKANARWHPIRVTTEELGDEIEDSLYYLEQSFPNLSAIAKFVMSRKVRDSGLKCVMTGEGSDEIFAGRC